MDSTQDSEVGRPAVGGIGPVGHDEVNRWIVCADVYRFLAGCFRYPETDVMATNLSVLALGLEKIQTVPKSVRAHMHRMAGLLNGVGGQDLRIEHERLFGTNPLCSPYETSYCPARKERILGDLAGFYRAFGLLPVAARPDMPDHICAEMEFMSVVLLKAAYGLRRGAREMSEVCLNAHQSFLADHVGRWYAAFADAAEERTDLDVFRSTADLLREWVETDLRLSHVSATSYSASPTIPFGDSSPACPIVS
ncbi:MAG: molecular chaperone TorD family protein [Nitrospirae bacterium]|nr:molecular chaperone TorD family protein [Nitrospirota bacterium]